VNKFTNTSLLLKRLTVKELSELLGKHRSTIYRAIKYIKNRPYRSCNRGLNEHTNGLIRIFFPKKTDFANVSEKQIGHVQKLLNDGPRKSLGFLTPNEVVNKYLTRAYKKLSQLTCQWEGKTQIWKVNFICNMV
jgi:IS30 family transposase